MPEALQMHPQPCLMVWTDPLRSLSPNNPVARHMQATSVSVLFTSSRNIVLGPRIALKGMLCSLK